MGWGWVLIWVWLRGGGGGRFFEAGHLLTFSAFRMGAYSRRALIRGWTLIRIKTVNVICLYMHSFNSICLQGKNVRSYSKTIPRNREMFWRKSTWIYGYKELSNISNESLNSYWIRLFVSYDESANYANHECSNLLQTITPSSSSTNEIIFLKSWDT